MSPTPPATPATVVSGVLFQFLDTSVQHTSTAMLPVLTALLLAGAEPSSYGFLSRGMAFGPYDNDLDTALCAFPNELPYVSPDPVVSTSNYMDSSVCSDSSTTTSPSWCASPSHDSQIELVLYPQKSMRNQLSNVTSLAYLRKLMITGAAADVLRPPSHDSQIELVLYPQKSMHNQLSNVTRLAYLRKLMITGAAADVLRPASVLSDFFASQRVHAFDHHALAARLFIELASQRVHALDHHALLQGDSVPPADSSTATTTSTSQDTSQEIVLYSKSDEPIPSTSQDISQEIVLYSESDDPIHSTSQDVSQEIVLYLYSKSDEPILAPPRSSFLFALLSHSLWSLVACPTLPAALLLSATIEPATSTTCLAAPSLPRPEGQSALPPDRAPTVHAHALARLARRGWWYSLWYTSWWLTSVQPPAACNGLPAAGYASPPPPAACSIRLHLATADE